MITAQRVALGDMIAVTEDGVTRFVPDDLANRDRRKLAEWEAAGGVIAAAEPEPAAAPDPQAAKLAAIEAELATLRARIDKVERPAR